MKAIAFREVERKEVFHLEAVGEARTSGCYVDRLQVSALL